MAAMSFGLRIKKTGCPECAAFVNRIRTADITTKIKNESIVEKGKPGARRVANEVPLDSSGPLAVCDHGGVRNS